MSLCDDTIKYFVLKYLISDSICLFISVQFFFCLIYVTDQIHMYIYILFMLFSIEEEWIEEYVHVPVGK